MAIEGSDNQNNTIAGAGIESNHATVNLQGDRRGKSEQPADCRENHKRLAKTLRDSHKRLAKGVDRNHMSMMENVSGAKKAHNAILLACLVIIFGFILQTALLLYTHSSLKHNITNLERAADATHIRRQAGLSALKHDILSEARSLMADAELRIGDKIAYAVSEITTTNTDARRQVHGKQMDFVRASAKTQDEHIDKILSQLSDGRKKILEEIEDAYKPR